MQVALDNVRKYSKKISEKMMQTIGYDVWIKLLEEQKKELQKANSCDVIGSSFYK